MRGRKAEPEERFHDKYIVEAESGCWLWQSKVNEGGYGIIARSMENGVRGRQVRAHRLSYEIHVGSIPDGLDLDHLCRVRRCVNPDHLEPVTRIENLRRGRGQSRPGLSHCKRGHAFTDENTRLTKSGYRQCRACHREYERVRRSLLRANLPATNIAAKF